MRAVAGGVVLTTTPCLVPEPPAWRAAVTAGRLWRDGKDWLPPSTPDPQGKGVLHVGFRDGPASTTVSVDLAGRDQQPILTMGQIKRPNKQGAISYSAVDADHVAFVFGRSDGDQAQNEWDLYAFDRHTHRLVRVISNPVSGGHPMQGGWVQPVLTKSHLYWIEASRDAVGRYSPTGFGSRLMSYAFSTGRTTTIYDGLTNALVAYQNLILFTAVPQDSSGASASSTAPAETVLAARQDTGALVAAPSGITAGADHASVITTNGDLIVWDATDGAVRGWRPEWGRSVEILPGVEQTWPGFGADRSSINAPRLTQRMLVWGAIQTYVLDLRSDTVTRLTTNHGGQDVSGSELAFWEYTSDQPPTSGQRLQFSEYLLDVDQLPELPGCAAAR